MRSLCANELNEAEIVALMVLYMGRPIKVEELRGFRRALLDVCIPVELKRPAIDVCGTGGDQKDTFNISTLSALVLAAAGIPVVKHGNYGSSSVSGSSDILAYLGYQFPSDNSEFQRKFDRHGICFLHAPLFHPALKHASASRKALGKRSFFNLLGPLVNPASVSHRYIGVYSADVARLYHYLLQHDDAQYCIVHSYDGYDEVSLTSDFSLATKQGNRIMQPADLGFEKLAPESLASGPSIGDAARIFRDVLHNTCTPGQKHVVIANSALAMNCYLPTLSLQDCVAKCRESIESLKALHLFNQLIQD